MKNQRAQLFVPLFKKSLWIHLAIWDIKNKYRISVLGPLWLVATMAATIAALTYVWTNVYGLEANKFIPYFTVSFIAWSFFTATVSETTNALIGAEHFLKNTDIPYSVFVYRIVMRNCLIALHNFLIVLVVIFFMPDAFKYHTVSLIFYFPIGAACFLLLTVSVALNIAILSLRFRDVIPLVNNLLTLLFFVTPILWEAKAVPQSKHFLFDWNPIFMALELFRNPLLNGAAPNVANLITVIVFSFLMIMVATYQYRRSSKEVPMWI
jgi:lipopolysaccharide transport system permease protein